MKVYKTPLSGSGLSVMAVGVVADSVSHERSTPSNVCSTSSDTARARAMTRGRATTEPMIVVCDAVGDAVWLSVAPDGTGVADGVRVYVGLARFELVSEGYAEFVLETEGVAPELSVGVGEPVGVRVPVLVGVALGVLVDDGVALEVEDQLAPRETGGVSVPEPDGVGDDVIVRVGVPVPVGFDVCEGVGVMDGDAPGVSVPVGDREGVRSAVGVLGMVGVGESPPAHVSAPGALQPDVVHTIIPHTTGTGGGSRMPSRAIAGQPA